MKVDVLIVGGGIAGLTAAAYAARAGRSVLLCEKEDQVGGLVNSFERDGFLFDGGVRAMENSGVLFPMLRQLGIAQDFIPNKISIGIEDKTIRFDSPADLEAYRALLAELYPESRDEVERIIAVIRTCMGYLEVQYGIDNPLFMDTMADPQYLMKEIMPWMLRYALTVPKITKLNIPVLDYLERIASNPSLKDIIAQHFFQETPAYFALSYLKLYLDYFYPRGGTGQLVKKLTDYIREHGGEIRVSAPITALDVEAKKATDAAGEVYGYRRLIWAADQVALYRVLASTPMADPKLRQAVAKRQQALADKRGNDSILTLFVECGLPAEYFAERCSAHYFYTPSREGQSACGPIPLGQERAAVEAWLERLFELTTYEISIPVLRDSSLAPEGKSGLIISLLFDYRLTEQVERQGWYEEFKDLCARHMLRVLDGSVFPGLEEAVLARFTSTPLTLARLTGNHEGAITGWSFTNRPVPAESRLPKIMNAVKTPLPGVLQAGQWTYSPSGLPVSFLTGKIAADKALAELKKE